MRLSLHNGTFFSQSWNEEGGLMGIIEWYPVLVTAGLLKKGLSLTCSC